MKPTSSSAWPISLFPQLTNKSIDAGAIKQFTNVSMVSEKYISVREPASVAIVEPTSKAAPLRTSSRAPISSLFPLLPLAPHLFLDTNRYLFLAHARIYLASSLAHVFAGYSVQACP